MWVGLVSRLGGRKEGQDGGHEEHEEDEQMKLENKPRLLVTAVVRGRRARSRLVLIGGQSVKRWKYCNGNV